jgi:Family of unknown function (DUF6868)
MNLEIARDALLWCAVINYGVLLLWFLFFRFAHDWMYRFHGRWFRIPAEQFDAIHYTAMAIYKIGILLLNLVPYVALQIVG